MHRLRHLRHLPLLRLLDRQHQHRIQRAEPVDRIWTVRIHVNHLDGEPSNNIELRGCKSLIIIGNICENARKEAIVFAMPSWMDSDNEQVAIVGNNITNGGKADPNAYPAIGIYSVDSDHCTMGFNITGNFIANVDEGAGWSYAGRCAVRRRSRDLRKPMG